MKNNKIIMGTFAALFAISFSACKETSPSPSAPPVNETELITTVKLVFIDTVTKSAITAVFSDLDGPGGNAPKQFDTISLKPNRVYQTAIYLLDETKNPVDSTSNEVLKEGQDHLFVFSPSNVNITIQYADKDINNLPIGLSTFWLTTNSAMGSVKITLRHQPGVKDGTASPGETDVEVLFPFKIE